MTGGKQHRRCPNCGKPLYDTALTMDNVKALMCSANCRAEWEMKYANMLLGKSAPMGRKP